MKTEILDDYFREQKMSVLMLTSSHSKKDKRGKGQGPVPKEIGQCQADLSVLGNLSHWSKYAATEKNKIFPFVVSSFPPPRDPKSGRISFLCYPPAHTTYLKCCGAFSPSAYHSSLF